MSGMNKDSINHYFDLLQEVFDEHEFSAQFTIWMMPLEPRPPKVKKVW